MPSTPPNIGTSVLRTLHRIHRQLTDLTERLDRGPRQIRAAEANVAAPRGSCSRQAKAEAKTLRMAADQKQLQLKSSEDKVKDLRRKLNAATSNREYQALLEQIAADEMANSVLADEILEALEKIDAFQKNIAEAEAALAAAKQKAEQVRAEVAKQEPVAAGRHRPARSRVAAIRGDLARRHPRAVPPHRAAEGRRRPGHGRKPVLRRLQSANPAEHAATRSCSASRCSARPAAGCCTCRSRGGRD